MFHQQRQHINSVFPLQSVQNKKNYHWFVVSSVCIGAFMAALDASIVGVALPTMQASFKTNMADVEWVSLIYLLTLAALIVPFGRLADLYGRRWMYTTGFAVFLVGSYFCGAANSLTGLLAFRILQGIGAACLQSNSVSIITAATPQSDRGKAIGIQAFAQGLGLSLGPFIGGILVNGFGWHAIFYINVPIGVMGCIVALLFLPKSVRRRDGSRFDLLGSILLGLALVSLMYVLKEGFGANANLALDGGLVVIAAVLLFLFASFERRIKSPLIHLPYLKKSVIWIGNLSGVLSFSVMYAITLLGPFWLIHERGTSTLVAGFYLCIIPLGMAISTPIAGAMSDRLGRSRLTIVGMLLATVGGIGMAIQPREIVLFELGAFFIGCGLGTFTPPNNAQVMDATPKAYLGIAGGILNMSRTIGMGFGVTLGGVTEELFIQVFGTQNMTNVFRFCFLVAALIAFINLIIVLVTRRLEQTINP